MQSPTRVGSGRYLVTHPTRSMLCLLSGVAEKIWKDLQSANRLKGEHLQKGAILNRFVAAVYVLSVVSRRVEMRGNQCVVLPTMLPNQTLQNHE